MIKNIEQGSYTINEDGSNIIAINGTTNNIDFEGINASLVFQNVINSLSTTGGKINIRSGEYILEDIKINNHIQIQGEGTSTKLRGLGTAGKFIFDIGNGGNWNAANPLGFVKLSDMYIGGNVNKSIYGAINANFTTTLQLDNIQSWYINGPCIQLGTTSTQWGNEHTKVKNIQIYGNGPNFKGISTISSFLVLLENINAGASKSTGGDGIFVWNSDDIRIQNVQLSNCANAIHCKSAKINVENIWIENVNYGFYNEYAYGGTVKHIHNGGGIDNLEYYDTTSANNKLMISDYFMGQTILNGTTSGSLKWSQPDHFFHTKKFVGYLNNYQNSTNVVQTITFPTPFTNVPKKIADDTLGSSVSNINLTLPINMISPITGWIILEGY